MKIEYLPINQVKLNPDNPRQITKAKMALLVKSLQDCPALFDARPLLISTRTGENIIIGGNMRYRAAKQLKYEKAPCIMLHELTEAQEKEIAIKDNGAFGEWDYDILANQWSDLPLNDWGIDLPKDFITEPESEADAEPQIDRAAELNKKWQVKTGDLFQIGEHRLLCGDSSQQENIEIITKGEKATLVFTDPPYGVSIGKKNTMLNNFQKAGMCLNNLHMDDMLPEELGNMLLVILRLWKKIAMADDCSVFVCSPQGGGLGMMMMMMRDAGLEVKHIINWIKNAPTFSMGRLDYDYQHEPILFTWNKTHKRKKEGKMQTSLWSVNKPRGNKEHPTMKPIELPMNAILNHTDIGDIVADMFSGSGTTIVACQNLNRKCISIEISPDYCAVILDRMERAFPGIEIKRINENAG